MFEDENNEVETSEETQEEVELIEEEEEEEEETIDWKARAEKAEQAIEKAKKKAKTAPTVQTNGLSTQDIMALTRANIEDEDLDEVLDYAKYKGVSIAEALKSSVVKATLQERVEERKSAQAVHSGGGTRRATGVISDERLLADAAKGIMPESEADIAKLARLKFLKK